MVTIEELEKCKTYVDGLRLIGINYNTSASKQKLYNICKRLNFDFDLHIQKQKHIRVCKNCGKILKKGQKKFCSCSCSATYNNILREPKSENTRKKISDSLKIYHEKNKRVKELSKCNICGQINCKKEGICSHLKKWFNNLIPFGFDIKTLGSILVFNEYEKVYILLKKEYENNLSVNEIKEKYDFEKSVENLVHVLKTMGISLRTYGDALRNAVKRKRVKMPDVKNQYKCEWHTSWENIRCYLRSSYEKKFALTLDEKKTPYRVEFLKINYWDSQTQCYRTAIPDFYLPQTNEIFEIKSNYTFNKQNMIDKFNEYKKLGYIPFLVLEQKQYTDEEIKLL